MRGCYKTVITEEEWVDEEICRDPRQSGWELVAATKNLLITPKLQLLANYKICTSKQIAHQGKLSKALLGL